jgi:hypothetical protein
VDGNCSFLLPFFVYVQDLKPCHALAVAGGTVLFDFRLGVCNFDFLSAHQDFTQQNQGVPRETLALYGTELSSSPPYAYFRVLLRGTTQHCHILRTVRDSSFM